MDKARETALKALMEIDTKEAYSNLVLKKALKNDSFDSRDRAFITELVYGTVTRKLTLDWVISRFSKTKINKLSPWVLQILRLGIYQILFLDRVPQSAACNTSVDLAKRYARASSGFINAILRNISQNGRLILNEVRTGTEAGDLSIIYSFPEFLIRDWLMQFGRDFTEELLASLLERPEFSARVNTLKTTREKVVETLANDGIEARNGRYLDEALILNNVSDISRARAYINGEITIQDESSMLVTKILDPKPGERVLDVCAAPGGKTTHMAQYMKNEGQIIAWDIHEHKVRLIEENAKRLGIENIAASRKDASEMEEDAVGRFDRVLVDAPCSGTGIIRRKPEIKWQRTEEDVGSLIEIQKKILYNASRYVRPGGTLVYSTCSLDTRENDRVIRAFLEENSGFKPEPLNELIPEQLKGKKDIIHGMLKLYPHIDGTDGFFISRLGKTSG